MCVAKPQHLLQHSKAQELSELRMLKVGLDMRHRDIEEDGLHDMSERTSGTHAQALAQGG